MAFPPDTMEGKAGSLALGVECLHVTGWATPIEYRAITRCMVERPRRPLWVTSAAGYRHIHISRDLPSDSASFDSSRREVMTSATVARS